MLIPFILSLSACAAVALGIWIAFIAERPEKKPVVLEDDDELNIEFGYDLGAHFAQVEEEQQNFTRSYFLRGRSFYDRFVGKALKNALTVGGRYTPKSYLDRTTAKLQHAGKRGPEELDRFIAMRIVTLVIGIALVLLTLWVAGGHILLPFLDPKMNLAVVGLAALFALGGPEAVLDRQAAERQLLIQHSLPDVLDLLTISVEAGLGFEQAIQYVSEMMEGPLPDEFNRMNAEMRAGASRADALRALEERVGTDDMRHFIMAILQADRFGVSIARILRSQADELRIKRHHLAQEKAQKAPVKMLLPMTFFIFPPLFIVVLGPAIMSIAANFNNA